MSGNSGLSRRQTAPIVSSRCGGAASRAAVSSRSSSRQEGEPVLADLELVAVAQPLRLLDPAAVDERAVEAALVLDREARRPRSTSTACRRETVTSSRKMPQSGERPIVVRSPCGRNVSPERPPPERTTSAGPSIPRSSAAPASSESSTGVNVCVVSAGVVLHEQRAAAGAVVRGLRVLEAALGAVDVAHRSPLRSVASTFRRGSPISDSTSTCSRTLLPPVFWSRATSSARRMSILPCRMRRRYETSFSSRFELVDELLQIIVGERGEIGQGFHETPFGSRVRGPIEAGVPSKGQPLVESLASRQAVVRSSACAPCTIASTTSRISRSSSSEPSSESPSA